MVWGIFILMKGIIKNINFKEHVVSIETLQVQFYIVTLFY